MDDEKEVKKKGKKKKENSMGYAPKKKLLILKDILYENADEERGIAMSEIQQKLKAACGTEPDVKTIYNDLAVIEEYGMKDGMRIIRPYGKETEYRLVKRKNELSYVEIKMLIDVVQSSRFLTKKQADTIIEKLRCLCSKRERMTLNHNVIIANRAKTDNFHILYTMDKIHTAIETDKQIKFQYYGYDMYKKKEYHHFGNEYRVNPHALIYHQGIYLLLAVPAKDSRVRVYRVDRMENLEISHADRTQKEIMEKINIEKYAYGLFGVYTGRFYDVELKCHKSVIDIVFDRFGFDIPITRVDDDYFRIIVSVALNADFFGWLVAMGGRVAIESPSYARIRFNRACSKVNSPVYEYGKKKRRRFFFFHE